MVWVCVCSTDMFLDSSTVIGMCGGMGVCVVQTCFWTVLL